MSPRPTARSHTRTALAVVCCLALSLAAPGWSQGGTTLDRVRSQGILEIGTDATYPPFEFIEDEKIQGFDIDLGEEIARELGVRARWNNIEWSGIFGGLETGKYDLVISDVVITSERKAVRAFSRPYFLSGQTIARRVGDTRLKSKDDLPGRIIAVQQQTTGQFAVEKMGLPTSSLRKFDTMQDALQDVQNGASDAAVGDLPALKEMIRKGYPGLELVGGIFVSENYAVVARQSDVQLVGAVNAALERILVDGRYARMYEKWIREPLRGATIAGLEAVKGEGTVVPEYDLRNPSAATALPPQLDTWKGLDTWRVVQKALPSLLRGALMTLYLTGFGLLVGIPLGLIIALMRLSSFRPVSMVALAYTEVVRGTPLLLQIYVIYFVLPSLGLSLPQFAAAVAALGLNAAAYVSETFRAGIESIEEGQMEAAWSLGLNYWQAMSWVILPQTLRRVLPPLTNEAVALLKDSSLVSVIALTELTRVGKEAATVAGSPGGVYLAMALLYLLMTLPLTHLVRVLEVRWRPVSLARGTV